MIIEAPYQSCSWCVVPGRLGITLIPSLAADGVRPDIVLASLHPDDSPVRSVYAATPQGITGPPAVPAFLGCLDHAVERLQARLTARAAEPHRREAIG
jgi:DNA-binding transcriptional LysR family regulator